MILLSFDIEEFDVPREKGLNFPLKDAMAVSVRGTNNILDILARHQVKATLFCTANFVLNAPDTIERAIKEGHEISAHGVDHWKPKDDDPAVSKRLIEEACGVDIKGYRQPRMFPVSDKLIEKCGYLYNSSLNPAFIPGKYMHLDTPRTPFMKGEVLQIPASVTPRFRVPLFWLSLHDFPEGMYYKMVCRVLKHDGYFTTYFHPWEFVDLPKSIRKYLLPIVNHNLGEGMRSRLENLILMLKSIGENFGVYSDFANEMINDLHGEQISEPVRDQISNSAKEQTSNFANKQTINSVSEHTRNYANKQSRSLND